MYDCKFSFADTLSSSFLRKSFKVASNSWAVILDADALTSFRKNPKNLYKLLDRNKIITPHIKEFNTIFPKLNKTKNNDLMTLTLALSYGSRDEIINSVKEIADKVKNNIILIIFKI